MSPRDELVCDMSGAPDSVEERLTAYRQVFAALVGRERRDREFRFRFARDRVDSALLGELVTRERACCPFLRTGLTAVPDEVWWDCGVDTPEAVPFLEALYALPDTLATAQVDPHGHLDPAGATVLRPSEG